MADTELTGRITQVTKKDDGFKLNGYEDWFNLSNYYEGPRPIPPTGSEVEIEFSPWTGNDGKVRFMVKTLRLAGTGAKPQPAAPAGPTPSPAPTSYDGYREAATQEQPPHPAAEPLAPWATPEPGSFPYRDLVIEPRTRRSIERQVALKAAVDALRMRPQPYESDSMIKGAVTDMAEHFIAWLEKRPVPKVESEPVTESP